MGSRSKQKGEAILREDGGDPCKIWRYSDEDDGGDGDDDDGEDGDDQDDDDNDDKMMMMMVVRNPH